MKTVIELAAQVEKGELSAVGSVRRCIQEARDQADLNAVSFLAEEAALSDAERQDASRRAGERIGKLAGVPIFVKDAIATRGLPTCSASRILMRKAGAALEPYRPPYDATVVERLKAEGAIIVGKANMDEFAMGSSNETSAYGPVKNPHDHQRIPGGSSGGSAALVAAGIAPSALGSDTGGSIRQPAALCGICGVKPTFGRVSRYGLFAFASSLDQIGPMTPDVRSSARLLEVMAGHDARDSTVSERKVGAYEAACDRTLSGLRVGLPEEYFQAGLDTAVREKTEAMVEALRESGAQIVPLRMPHTHYGVATYYVLATAEASSNLSRFDGVRFGYRESQDVRTIQDLYEQSRAHGFGPEVKRRILLGTYVLSAGYYDAYYGKAQRVRTLIQRDFDEAFQKVDVIVSPTSPTVAFRLGERNADPLAMYMADVYTLPASLAGVPAISVPIGTVPVDGKRLPVGIQLMAPAFAEELMFSAAALVESLAKSDERFH